MAVSAKLDAVQSAIIEAHREMFDESPSPMKLQKLCYYAQAYSLAEGIELFPEEFQAWQHGPVVPELYAKYRDYQWRVIDVELPALAGVRPDIVNEVVAAYGRFDGAALSTMTHRELPWKDARGDLEESEGSQNLISKRSMRDFFVTKLGHGG